MENKFENNIQELENIVKQLEGGELPLDDMIKKFEDGIKLSNICSKQLNDAESKVNILINKDGVMEKDLFAPLDEV